MTAEDHWQQVEDLLKNALALAPAERVAYLGSACKGSIRSEVESLLEYEGLAGGFLEAPGSDEVALLFTQHQAESLLGQHIGGFELVGVLGHGGMGVVYRAVQHNPKREVALKVIRGGAYVDQNRLRLFEREVRALARLRHPAIAAIHAAGGTDDGRHYFAMELISGLPLTEFARSRAIDIHARLKLFCRICDAISYAHQRGVIHRDIKPTNILIDDEDHPKILDFGLAKITDSDVAVTTIMTDVGRVQGTLAYMSPEQVRGDTDYIDVQSDVYSLGIVLYELLADQLPYDLSRATLPEAVRKICDDPPQRLSRISRGVGSDLETIVRKALAKEPDRRYQSAAALSDDLRRYLTNQPILARPPSTRYQISKMVSRHKALVALVGLLFLVVTISAVVGWTLYRSADRQARMAEAAVQKRKHAQTEAEHARASEEKQRELAEQRARQLVTVTQFQQSMLGQIDAEKMGREIIDELREGIRTGLEEKEHLSPTRIRSDLAAFDRLVGDVNATDLALAMLDKNVLARAAETIHEEFSAQPLVRATLQQTIATTYGEIGLYERALPLQVAALKTRRRVLGDEHPDTLSSVSKMGLLLKFMGRHEEALSFCREALEARRRILGDDHPDTLTSISNMGVLLRAMDRNDEAEPYYREALEARRRILGNDHADTLISINNMGVLLKNMGKLDEALPYYEESLVGSRRKLGDDHPDTLISISNMGALLYAMRKYDEAAPYAREALDIRRRQLGDNHPNTLISIKLLGYLLNSLGHYDEAATLLGSGEALARKVWTDDNARLLGTYLGALV